MFKLWPDGDVRVKKIKAGRVPHLRSIYNEDTGHKLKKRAREDECTDH